MSIEILRLRSGEDIMCYVLENNGTEYKVENPAVILPMGHDDGGTMRMALSPWMPYATTTEFMIPTDFIVTTAEPTQDIESSYAQMYGKIITPKKNILI
jgi:hypothetical protein